MVGSAPPYKLDVPIAKGKAKAAPKATTKNAAPSGMAAGSEGGGES